MPRRKIDLSTSGQGNIVDMITGKPVETPVLPVVCDRIRYFRSRLGMEQKRLASLIGVTKNSISNWESGRSRPDLSLLPSICNALNITLYDLFDMSDPTILYSAREQMLVENYNELSEGHKHAVDTLINTLRDVEAFETCPELTTLTYFAHRLAAGIGDPTEFDDDGETVYVYSSPETKRADCIFTVNGNSMEPEYHSGQDVLVQRISSGIDLQYGDIGAFIIGNETYIKEYQEDGLHSLNPSYPTIRFDENVSVYLIGRVIGILDKDAYPRSEIVEKYKLIHGIDE